MADAILAGAPYSDFPNGLPLLIAWVKLVTGGDHLVDALLILNVAMSTASILLVFLIFSRVFGRAEAAIAAALVSLLPNQLNYVPQVMSEVPCAFALLLATWLLVSGRYATAGLAYYLTTFIRTNLAPVGLILIGVLCVQRRWRDASMLGGGLAAGAVIDLALQGAGIIAAPSNLALNLLVSISNTSSGGIDFSTDHFSAWERAHPLATHVNFIMAHPGEYLRMKVSAVWELWGPWPSDGAPFSHRGPASQAAIGLRFPLLVLACLAFRDGYRRLEIWALATPAMVLTLVHIAFFANARFSYPAEPLVAILAVAWSCQQIQRWQVATPGRLA